MTESFIRKRLDSDTAARCLDSGLVGRSWMFKSRSSLKNFWTNEDDNSAGIVESIKVMILDLERQPDVLPMSEIGKAVNYATNQRPTLANSCIYHIRAPLPHSQRSKVACRFLDRHLITFGNFHFGSSHFSWSPLIAASSISTAICSRSR